MSADHATGGSARHPSHDAVEKRLGPWQTFAGETPTAKELIEAGDAIANGEETASETACMQTLRYVWRRQKMPHGSEWKRAETACENALEASR